MIRLTSSWCILLFCLAASLAHAAPAHVIRFSAPGRRDGCNQLGWGSPLLAYNTTSTTLRIRVLGISNGTPDKTSPDTIDIPPGEAVSASEALRDAWIPPLPGLWVMHLDVPEGVVLESRDEMFQLFPCIQSPIGPVSVGKASLPIFKESTRANVRQVHLGTDVGGIAARINVGIYNAGNVLANAHVEVRRVCDNSVVESRDIQIPPDTLIQTATFSAASWRVTTAPQIHGCGIR